jgi:hypothetical protein
MKPFFDIEGYVNFLAPSPRFRFLFDADAPDGFALGLRPLGNEMRIVDLVKSSLDFPTGSLVRLPLASDPLVSRCGSWT